MPDRTRPIRKEICLNKQELNLIQHKMRQLGTHNFGAYARKMLIDGYIIKVDYTEQKKLAAAVSRAASNINQICRRINSTGRCYEDDVAELKAQQAEIWELLKEFLKKSLRLPYRDGLALNDSSGLSFIAVLNTSDVLSAFVLFTITLLVLLNKYSTLFIL